MAIQAGGHGRLMPARFTFRTMAHAMPCSQARWFHALRLEDTHDTQDASGQVFYVCSDVSIPLLANNISLQHLQCQYLRGVYNTITHMQIKPYKQSKTHVNKIKQAK
jgi:hypothetical protein